MVLPGPTHSFVTSTSAIEITTTTPLDVTITDPVQIDDSTPVEVNVQQPVNISTAAPLDVNVTNQVQIDDTTPVEVNVQQPVNISTAGPLDVNVTNDVTIDDTTPVDINVTNVTLDAFVTNPTPWSTNANVTNASIDVYLLNTSLNEDVDVNVTNTNLDVTVDDTTPVNVSIADPVVIDDTTPVNVNVQTQEVIPELELIRGNLSNYTQIRINATAVNAGATTQVMVNDGVAYDMPLQTNPVGLACSMVLDNAAAIGMVIILSYFQNNTDTVPITEMLVTNGQTPVALSNPFFRMVSMSVSPASPSQFDSQLYIYDSTIVPVLGVPASYFDYMQCSYLSKGGFRQTGVYYSPPNKNTILQKLLITGDFNGTADVFEISTRLYINALSPVIYFQRWFTNNATTNIDEINSTLPAGSTMQIRCQRVSGAGNHDLVLVANAIQVDP